MILITLVVAILCLAPMQMHNNKAKPSQTVLADGLARCIGATPCHACKSCSGCAHCTSGGTCGTCANSIVPATPSATSNRNTKVQEPATRTTDSVGSFIKDSTKHSSIDVPVLPTPVDAYSVKRVTDPHGIDSLKKCLDGRSLDDLLLMVSDTANMIHNEPDLFAMNMNVDGTLVECLPMGTTHDIHRQKMYAKKARYRTPRWFERLQLSDVFNAPNDMPSGWYEGMPVEITAYAVKIFLNPRGEGCNCSNSTVSYNKSTDAWADTRIYLTLKCDENSDTSSYLLGEVSPRIKQLQTLKGNNYSTSLLEEQFEGQWVKVRGYLFYDCEHEDESTNNGARKKTHKTNTNRLTGWEIHPIISIELADAECP